MNILFLGDLVGETSGQATKAASKVTGAALETTGDLVTGTASVLAAGPRALSRIWRLNLREESSREKLKVKH